MKFTEQDLQKQREEFSRLAQELASLNTRFESRKRELGFPEGKDMDAASIGSAPELEAAMAEARDFAEREGRRAADELRHTLAPAAESSVTSSPRMRRGAIRI